MTKGLNTDVTKYVNCMAAFKSKDEIIYSPDPAQIYSFLRTGQIEDKSKVGIVGSQNTLIAVGGRPVPYPEFKYADLSRLNYLQSKNYDEYPIDETSKMFLKYAITSDDLFSLPEPPKQALIIGSGYIGLECASFLSKLGTETTLLARSRILRTFDDDITSKITDFVNTKTKIDLMQGFEVSTIEKIGHDVSTGKPRFLVRFKTSRGELSDIRKEYDTIILATGRYAKTNSLGLENVGIKPCPSTGKIRAREEFSEKTDVDGIYVVGDALLGAPELTPTAIMSGVNVAKQVFNSVSGVEASKVNQLNYKFTPTTIFSYPEYSACGYTEAEANKIFGEN